MDEEPVLVIAGKRLSKLLNRPLGCRMGGHIAMENATRAGLHEHEYIKDAEAGGHDKHEIASQQGMGMIAHERVPGLRRQARVAGRIVRGPVGSDGPR